MPNTLMKQEFVPATVVEIDLAAIVEQCFLENSGDAQAAARSLTLKARKDTRLFMAITEPALPGAVWNLIQNYCHRERRQIVRVISQERSPRERIELLGNAHIKSLYDMHLPLPGYPKLGDADKNMILKAAQVWLKQAKDMDRKGRWLNLVSAKMKDGIPLRKQISQDKLAESFAIVGDDK